MTARLFLPIVALLALAACNTAAGLGEDVQAAGGALEREAVTAQ